MLKTYRIIPFTLFLFVLTLTTASSGFTPSREWSVHDAACGEDGDDAVIFTLRGGKNPTCWKNLAISLQAQLDAPQAQLDAPPEPVASIPSVPSSIPFCKESEVDTEAWVPRKKLGSMKQRMQKCMKQACPGRPINVHLCPNRGSAAVDQFGYRYNFKE